MNVFEGPRLEPVPMVLGWSSTREMLEEIMACVSDETVRDFVMRNPAKMDVEMLTSPTHLKMGVSTTACHRVCGSHDYGDNEVNNLTVGLVIPTHSTNEYAFALGVCNHDVNGEAKKYFNVTEQLFHYVFSAQNMSVLGFSVDETKSRVSTHYSKTNSIGAVNVVLHFESRLFFSAFKSKGSINIENLIRALRMSLVMNVDRGMKFPRMLPKYTGPILTGEQLPSIYRLGIHNGNQFMRSIATAYHEGVVIMLRRSTIMMSENWGTHHGTVESMKKWAVSHRLSSAVPVVQAHVSSFGALQSVEEQVGGASETKNATTNNMGEGRETRNVGVRIAPAWKNKHIAKRLNYAQMLDAVTEEKKLRRKIKNRMSAARSNARRRAKRGTALREGNSFNASREGEVM